MVDLWRTYVQAKLTARIIASLQVRNAPFEVVDTETKGFLLRVQPSGWMTYYFSYRTQEGRRARCRIGRHGSVSPAQAALPPPTSDEPSLGIRRLRGLGAGLIAVGAVVVLAAGAFVRRRSQAR